MKDRRHQFRALGSNQLCSDAMLHHQRQAAALSAELLLSTCGVKILREEPHATVEVPAAPKPR